MANPTTLNTYVRNVSGGPLFFGFLGRHGVTLQTGAGYNFFGDIFDYAINQKGKTRTVNAILAALANGLITIDSTPGVILYDTGTGHAKMLQNSNGTLGTIELPWGTFSGSE